MGYGSRGEPCRTTTQRTTATKGMKGTTATTAVMRVMGLMVTTVDMRVMVRTLGR
uniref:hypothetical protein n=1 Tax=Saccharothrix mutabilis TaxID=33921 RepID=UPI0031DCDD3D